jgi:hypothetical protein
LGYTGSGATGVNWTNKSATYTAVNTDGIIADTSGGSFTVTLPASPSTGSYVVFVDGGNSFQAYPLTVAGNGSTIDGSYTSAVLNITNAKVEFIYSGSTWEMATSTGTRGYTGSLGYTGSIGYTGSLGYTGSASTVIGYTGSKGDIGYTGSIPAALTATSLALGGATLGTNALAATGTAAISGNVTIGGTNNVATGTIGIGVTNNAAVLVDGRLDANTNTYGYRFVNGSAGTAATTLAVLGNGTNALQFNMFGTAWTTSGINRQGGGMVLCDGPGGLTLNTQAAQPIYFGINSAEAARIDASGRLQVGTTAGTGRINMANAGGGLQQINSTGGAQEILNLFSDNNLYFSAPSNIIIRPGGGGEAARFDTSGILGIGITPSAWGTFNAVQVGLLSIASYTNGDTDISSNLYYNSGWKYIGTGRSAQIKLDSSTGGGDIKFFVDATGGTAAGATAGTEAARIDSGGSLLVGTTDQDANVGGASGAVCWGFRAGYGIRSSINTDSHYWNRYATGTLFAFRYDGTDVGSISVAVSSTAYNTSSDARLKTNVSDADPASALIDAIQVRQFDWKVDNSHQRYGMVAQELLEVAPEAVSVPTDPEQMMGVDYSKLVPMMIKTIQELTTRLAALEAK